MYIHGVTKLFSSCFHYLLKRYLPAGLNPRKYLWHQCVIYAIISILLHIREQLIFFPHSVSWEIHFNNVIFFTLETTNSLCNIILALYKLSIPHQTFICWIYFQLIIPVWGNVFFIRFWKWCCDIIIIYHSSDYCTPRIGDLCHLGFC